MGWLSFSIFFPSIHFLVFTNYYQHVALFYLLVSCIFPVCVIAFTYIMTARHLLDSSRLISEETQNIRQNKRKNTAKFVLGLTVVLCWDLLLFCFGTYCCFVLGLTVVLCWDFLLFCDGTYCCIVLGLTVVLCWDLLLFSLTAMNLITYLKRVYFPGYVWTFIMLKF